MKKICCLRSQGHWCWLALRAVPVTLKGSGDPLYMVDSPEQNPYPIQIIG